MLPPAISIRSGSITHDSNSILSLRRYLWYFSDPIMSSISLTPVNFKTSRCLFEITIPNALYKYSSKYFLYFNFGSFPISSATDPLHNSVNLPESSSGMVNTTKALNSPLTYVPNRPSLNKACFLSGLFLIASANKSVTLCVTLIFLPPFYSSSCP